MSTSERYDVEIMQRHEATGYAAPWRYTLLPDLRYDYAEPMHEFMPPPPFLEGLENRNMNASKSVDLPQLIVHGIIYRAINRR
jgi:hypothetical protein